MKEKLRKEGVYIRNDLTYKFEMIYVFLMATEKFLRLNYSQKA